ncbi:hypothetical protein KEM48_008689 [Puccinia striiformis f. sp. tritici PST-130]|nr:hypothetical protein H4Q26_008834 [Puccinia striiformis f. sp. tritici PST-130]KAI9624797.1 hypothetical protein KEM48_008689 [Puccinia striiformis f. sp. tritici PST-130]KNE93274.1 hypothetical protein PSTG_13314 [Puccinia striiformis f. sp. tritici PST-78]
MIAVTTPDTIPCRVKGVFCYRYTPYRNVSFCIDELIKIIQDIERRQILVDEYRNNNQRKQKTYGILLHSIGRRTGFKSVYRILPELISKGYIHDEYTSSCRHPVPSRRNKSVVEEQDDRLLKTVEEIKKANMKTDEVTLNILVRSFLGRATHHLKEEISNIKRISLDHRFDLKDLPSSNLGLDRKRFGRFTKPLCSMLSNAYPRANCTHKFNQLKIERKFETRKFKSNSNIK